MVSVIPVGNYFGKGPIKGIDAKVRAQPHAPPHPGTRGAWRGVEGSLPRISFCLVSARTIGRLDRFPPAQRDSMSLYSPLAARLIMTDFDRAAPKQLTTSAVAA